MFDKYRKMTRTIEHLMYKKVLIAKKNQENSQRPWKCQFCQLTFKYKDCIQDHLERYHAIEFKAILRSRNLRKCKQHKRQNRPSVIVSLESVQKQIQE